MPAERKKLSFMTMYVTVFFAMFYSLIANCILFAIGKNTDIIPESFPLLPNGDPFTLPPVIIASTLPVVVAAVVYWGISKMSSNYHKIFTIVAIVLLIVSCISPFRVPDIPTNFALFLCGMHAIVAGMVIYFFKAFKPEA